MSLKIFAVMKIQVMVFWVVTTCGVMVGYQCFGGPCCLQGKVHSAPPKHWYPTVSLHGVITQKTTALK